MLRYVDFVSWDGGVKMGRQLAKERRKNLKWRTYMKSRLYKDYEKGYKHTEDIELK